MLKFLTLNENHIIVGSRSSSTFIACYNDELYRAFPRTCRAQDSHMNDGFVFIDKFNVYFIFEEPIFYV